VKKSLRWLLLLLLLLVACGQNGAFRTAGKLKIPASEPPLERCLLRAGDYFLLKGNDFGTREDWEAGINTLTLPEAHPTEAELTKQSDPATLMAQVPEGAVSGTAQLHIEGVGNATFEVRIEGGATPTQVLPECRPPDPSGSG